MRDVDSVGNGYVRGTMLWLTCHYLGGYNLDLFFIPCGPIVYSMRTYE